MAQAFSYGLMIGMAAILYLLYWRKTKPVRDACDRFAATFMEARDYAVGGENCTLSVEKHGGVHLRAGQSRGAEEMLARGADGTMARYDKALEALLNELFQHIGKSGHLKTRYFDYLNTFFTLQKQFLQICIVPDTVMEEGDWKNLELYTGNRQKLVQILSMRLGEKGKRSLDDRREGERNVVRERGEAG